MAVREFNGTSDHVKLSIGTLSAATHGTYAAIYKVDNTAAVRAFMTFLNSGSSFLWAPLLIEGDDTLVYVGSGAVTAPTSPQAVWVLAVVRKATGTATPRFSIYNFNTTTWTHGDASGTTGNGTAPTSGFINTNTGDGGAGGEAFDGRLAVTAAWVNALPWSADGTGDTNIENAGLHTSLQGWIDQTPDALWPWNPTVAAGIVDIMSSGANQTTISGTSEILGDDPPGFTFDLGSPPVLEAGPQVNVTRSSNRFA